MINGKQCAVCDYFLYKPPKTHSRRRREGGTNLHKSDGFRAYCKQESSKEQVSTEICNDKTRCNVI